ncbi:MAG: hypothetical protein SFY32_11690 [Bacteroidota bacterium]|nr:hypothetical protein [Bacteroidota bacterium]
MKLLLLLIFGFSYGQMIEAHNPDYIDLYCDKKFIYIKIHNMYDTASIINEEDDLMEADSIIYYLPELKAKLSLHTSLDYLIENRVIAKRPKGFNKKLIVEYRAYINGFTYDYHKYLIKPVINHRLPD